MGRLLKRVDELGLRVPWIVRWHGRVPARRIDEQSLLSGTDYLPTLCAITGIKINAADFEGEDTSGAWIGREAHVRTKPLIWKASYPGSEALIREGQWKLRYPTRKKDGEVELYDIIADPAEANNLTVKFPDIVKSLSKKIEAWVVSLPKQYEKTDYKLD